MQIPVFLISIVLVCVFLIALIIALGLRKLLKNKTDANNELLAKFDNCKNENIQFQANSKIAVEKFTFLQTSIIEERKNYENKFHQQKLELAEKDRQINLLSVDVASLQSDLKNQKLNFDTQKNEIENIGNKFRAEFQNLANDILEEKSKKFTAQNKENISGILKPLNEKIKDFEKRIAESYDKESQQRFSLKEEVKRLAELNQQISREASNLTNALKGEAKTQGNWGELILENILEKSGLAKNREYFIQKSFVSQSDKRLQPDIVVSYPGNRHVVIDSKVSLVAYERYSSADNLEMQELSKKEHLVSVKNHIRELSKKNYHELYQLNSLDFVMMFLPIEPAYLLAIQSEPELWNYAYERRILLMSPTNLIAALKMVSSLWQHELQNRNVQEIAKRSGELYDKFVGLYNDLEEVGKKIDSSQEVYKNAMKKLREGKGNLIRKVEMIKSLGAKANKNLPEKVVLKAQNIND